MTTQEEKTGLQSLQIELTTADDEKLINPADSPSPRDPSVTPSNEIEQTPTTDFLDFKKRQQTLTRAYIKSNQSIDYPRSENEYFESKTDPNKGFGVVEVGMQIAKYNDSLLNSPFKICRCFPGSFCYYLYHKRGLIFEQLFYVLLFLSIVFWTSMNKYNIIPKVIISTNSMGTLVAFFLGLYVSLSVARWWRLRTDGIGNIWSATSGMATLLGPVYEMYRDDLYRDTKINVDVRKNKLKRMLIHLKKIQRYCQCSLALVFSANGQAGFTRNELVTRGIMSKAEHDSIFPTKNKKGIPGSYQEYMWSLVSREIMILRHEFKKLVDDALARTLHEQVLKGRSGAGLIAAQLGTQLPLTYAHGVTLMAKAYNGIMCVTSAIEFVHIWTQDLRDANPEKYTGLTTTQIIDEASIFFTWNVIISCLALLVKTTSISMLLVLCQKISNPFDNDIIAYPGLKYVKWIYLDFE
eukprot:547162_1